LLLGLVVVAEEWGVAAVTSARESRPRLYEQLQQRGEGGGGEAVWRTVRAAVAAAAAAAAAVMAIMRGEGVGAATGRHLIQAIHCKERRNDADGEG